MHSYGSLRLGVARLGMLADTSDYNIDGACVVAPGQKVYFGTPVAVVGIVDGVKLVKTIGGSDIPYGIAFVSNYCEQKYDTNADYTYLNEGEPVSIVTHGRIWSLGAKAVTLAFGDKVKASALIGIIADSGYQTGWPFAGGRVPYNSDTDLIEVQVLQNANIVPPPPILVASATLSASAATPSANNAPVTISAAVLPANATNKTGKFTANAGTIATINQTTGVLTPAGGALFGNVDVTWTANDASGVTATYTHRFEVPTP